MKRIFNFRFTAILVSIFLFLVALLFSPIAFAGQTGVEGGTLVSPSYNVSAGGSVTMHLYQSSDLELLNDNQLISTMTVTGQTSGSYPTSADLNGNYIALGTVGLDRISISPASGYKIADLVVDGTSKGALSSYDFAGSGPVSFRVSFAQEVVQAPPPVVPVTTTPVPPTTTPKTVTSTTSVVAETPVAEPVAEEALVETPAVTPVATEAVTTTSTKKSSFPLWLLLLIIFLILLLLFLILFLLWKRRKKKEKKNLTVDNSAK